MSTNAMTMRSSLGNSFASFFAGVVLGGVGELIRIQRGRFVAHTHAQRTRSARRVACLCARAERRQSRLREKDDTVRGVSDRARRLALARGSRWPPAYNPSRSDK